MDTKFQSSFIPKKPLLSSEKPMHHTSINLLFLIGFIVFCLSITSAVGVFIWKGILESKIATNEKTLASTKEAFDPTLIQTLTRLETKLVSSKQLLNNHVAISAFFDLLQSITLKTVRFTSFEYTLGDKNTISVTMKGEGESFSSIALQSDVFAKNKFLKDPIVANLTLEQNGNVGFTFAATIDSSVLLYKNSTAFAEAAVESSPQETTATNTPVKIIEQ